MKKLLQVTFYQLIIMSLLIAGLVTGISVVSANTLGGGVSNPISDPVSPTPTPTGTPISNPVTPTPTPISNPVTPTPTATPISEPIGSTVKIYAKGTSANGVYPTMALALSGKYITHWENVSPMPIVGWREYTYKFSYKVIASQIGIAFTNDLWLPSVNQDRNLLVDKIVLDGVTYQTEDIKTYANGVSSATQACAKGNLQSQILHCNGYFVYNSN